MNKPSNTSELLELLNNENLKSEITIIDEAPMNFRYKGMILTYNNHKLGGQIKYQHDTYPHIIFGKDLPTIRNENPKELLLEALELVDKYKQNQ